MSVKPEFDVPPSSKLLPYLRLMRLPNVFTAIADVAMGFAFVNSTLPLAQTWPALAALIAASALLYTAGMVLNDVFDIEIDRLERPFRPLPSGQIAFGTARVLGFAMLVAGVVVGSTAGWLHPLNTAPFRSGIVAALLALAILLYDGGLKRTPIGPLGMGLCRFLNVLLGMSAAGNEQIVGDAWLGYEAGSWVIAAGVGTYIAGVTWFARDEASESRALPLTGALATMILGIAMLAFFPWTREDSQLNTKRAWFAMLLTILALPIGRRALVAITDPSPGKVQELVKFCLMSLILFDSAVTLAAAGAVPGLAVIALIVPMFLLGRWVYST